MTMIMSFESFSRVIVELQRARMTSLSGGTLRRICAHRDQVGKVGSPFIFGQNAKQEGKGVERTQSPTPWQEYRPRLPGQRIGSAQCARGQHRYL
jgi:hypothetical protein